MFDVQPVTSDAADGSCRSALDTAATRDIVKAAEREIEESLAQEMASAGVAQGGIRPATIGPGTVGSLSAGRGEGRRRSDTLLRQVQDRPQTEFA